ncbi:MAG: DUF493 family protein [gamma proteobacterium endosymbiont of Trioza apicalis]
MKNKFNKLLKFPCLFTLKIICNNYKKLIYQIIKIIRFYVRYVYLSYIKISNLKKYYSLSIIIIIYYSYQLEKLYIKLKKLDLVKIIL